MQLRNTLELILYKAYSDIKAEAARSFLGLFWWIVEPILYVATFYILFVLVLHRGGPDFVPNFLCGAVVWKWFDSGLKGGSNAISTHRGLLQQVRVPKFIFPVIAVFGSTARFLPVFFIFCFFLIFFFGMPVHATWFAAPLIIFTQLLLVLSLALLVGAITPFLPDLKVAIDSGMMLLFFMSGVLFNIGDVHEPLRSYLLINPMVGLIDEYRNVLVRGIWPDTERLGAIVILSILVGGLGLGLLKRMDHKYGKARF
jgi:lipopolysaccharide transport system permease protein